MKQAKFEVSRHFPGEHMQGIAWNFVCWCILTIFRTDKISVMVCWFSSFWRHFDLMERIKFGVSGHFPENAWSEWPEILHANVFWRPSELIRFWLCSVDFPHYGTPLRLWLSETGHIWSLRALSGGGLGVNVEGGSGGIFPTLCVQFCLFNAKTFKIYANVVVSVTFDIISRFCQIYGFVFSECKCSSCSSYICPSDCW